MLIRREGFAAKSEGLVLFERLGIATLIFSLSLNVFADVSLSHETEDFMTLSVVEFHTLGMNDTLLSATKYNIDSIKKSSADYAGTYVESKLTVTDSSVTEQQVRLLTAGYVELLSTEHKRSINEAGDLVLSTKASVRISKKSIKDGLEKLKTDPARLEQIKLLEADNEKLRKQLSSIITELDVDQSRFDLLQARDLLLKSLDDNRIASKRVFDEGMLLNIANADSNSLESAKADLAINLLQIIENDMTVSVGSVSIKDQNSGYDLHVQLSWNLSSEQIMPVFERHFGGLSIRKHGYIMYGVGIELPTQNHGSLQQERLAEYISSKQVILEVDVGLPDVGKQYVLIGAPQKGTQWIVQLSNDSKYRTELQRRGSEHNPVTFEGLTKEQLNAIFTITAKAKVVTEAEINLLNTLSLYHKFNSIPDRDFVERKMLKDLKERKAALEDAVNRQQRLSGV